MVIHSPKATGHYLNFKAYCSFLALSANCSVISDTPRNRRIKSFRACASRNEERFDPRVRQIEIFQLEQKTEP